MSGFYVSSEEFQSARAECDDTSHVEKIFQQKNTFAIINNQPADFIYCMDDARLF